MAETALYSVDPALLTEDGEIDEEKMAQLERELAEDAQWKRIQKNTFTRWANEHLKMASTEIVNLETDLSDGLRLIKLLQVLSGKVLPRHSKKPTFRSQKLENVSVALKFLEHEHIRIVNIDSSHIVDSKLKLILGLIWTLILHYSISIPMLENDTDNQNGDQNITPKQRLMNWIQNKLGDVPVKNFTSDWRDGKAVGALVDSVAPGLCPDWDNWNPKHAVQNASVAMGLANEWLDVRQLIQPEDMVSPHVDELSMMTYLSQYPQAKLKAGAPLRSKSDANRVRAYGPGVEPTGVVSGVPTNFTVDTTAAGLGKVEVVVSNPLDQKEPVNLSSRDNQLYSVSYTPKMEGPHKVLVKFGGRDIPKSPFNVKVDQGVQLKPVSRPTSLVQPPTTPGGDSKIRVGGRGLQPKGVRVGDNADIQIYTDQPGDGDVQVLLIEPGGETQSLHLLKLAENKFETVYRPKKEGRYVVMIKYGGHEISKSPYEVNVGPMKESKIKAYGPGLTGGILCSPALFTVETNDETGSLGFTIKGPSQARIECSDNHNGSADVRYYPTAAGEYAVHVLCNDEDIPESPFIAHIQPAAPIYPEMVEVFGPGIQPNGVVHGNPTYFTVSAENAGNAKLDVSVMDNDYSPVQVTVTDNKNGRYTCTYQPSGPGRHIVQASYGGVAVEKSPFNVNVGGDSRNVRVYGPGVEAGVKAYKPTIFTIDCSEMGKGDAKVAILSADNREVKLRIEEVNDGIYEVCYTPVEAGDYKVHIQYGDNEIPQSPIKVNVLPSVDVSKIKVLDLEPTVPMNSLQQFRVVTQGAGQGEFVVGITSPSGIHVKAHVVPTHGGYLVKFTPTELGEYLLGLSFGGEPVNPSPYIIKCTYGYDPRKVRACGPGLERGIIYNPAEFTIDTRGAGQGGLGVTVEGPCEACINCRDNGDGTCSVAYLPTEPGDYTINITFNDQHIQGSPFQAVIAPDVDVSKIKVSGKGIQPYGLSTNVPTKFRVDSRAIENPKEKKLTCQITNPSGGKTDNIVKPYADGTYQISYTPFEEGRHVIEILYDGIPIPGSPFDVNVENRQPKKCKVNGPGLEKGFVDKPNRITLTQEGNQAERLEIFMEGPTEPALSLKENEDGTVDIVYEPEEPGNYDLVIKYGGKSIDGSPFSIPVVNGEDNHGTAVAFGPGLQPDKVRSNIPTHFQIRASKPGAALVEFSTGQDPIAQRPVVRDNQDGTYTVNYIPPEAGAPMTINIKHDGQHVPNSPFHIVVLPEVEADNVKMNGPGLTAGTIPASIPTHFLIDTSKAGYADLKVQVLGPDGLPRKVVVNDIGGGIFKAAYTPDDCGRYTVNVKYGNDAVPGCPATVQAVSTGTAENCQITEGIQRSLNRGEEYCITVNTKNAGYGAVTCKIRSTSGSDVDIDIEDNEDGTFSIYYTVQDAGDYTLCVKFGGQPVPEGVYTFSVTSENTEESKKSIRSQRSSKFRKVKLYNIPLPTTGGQATAEVKMPTGNIAKPRIEDNRDGTVSISYDPKEEGLHELYIKYNGEHVQGSPFKFHVDSISSGYVTAYGPGLSHGVCGEPANFTISTKGAGSGGLKMAVEGPSKADISCHDNKDGTVAVTYLPTAPGEYKISVMFSDKHIKGSPFSAKITGEGRKRNQISVASCSEVSLPGKVTESEIRTFNASIVSPSGLEEPCYLKLLPNGNLCVSFTPRMPGEHQVSVKKMGKHIKNSPFKIDVKEPEVGDARKVQVSGALKEGKTQIENFFTVDTKNAGFGGLSLSIEGPSKTEISCSDLDDGSLKIGYKPTEPGYYIVNLKFADHHVTGSPFTVKVSGEGSNRVREKIQRQREAVPVTEVGSQCKLTFKMPGITSFDLSATVTSPGGVTEDAEINEVEDGLYAVHFVPKELGVHTVCVKYKEIHIPGSPFQFTVGPLKDSGAHRVHAGGPGLERGEQGQPCEFNVWTREAGAGSLAISVEGPSKAEIDYKDRKDGSCYVSYVVSEPGEYRIGIKFNDQHIPDSPYKVYIAPAVGDAHKLEVAQFPESGVKADQPSTFLVRKNGAKGELDGKIVSPSGMEDDCFIQSIDSDTYSVRFMPRENGIHNIHCKFNGVHIPGSPFRIKVGKEDADPAAVHAFGAGLHEIKTGVKTDFIVDTCNAGAGNLAVTVDGPSKVAMDCSEIEEGYKVRYTPLSPGDYYVSVKYNGYHIVGSPYKVSCIGDDLAESGAQETSSVVVETVHKVSKNNKQGPVLPLFKSDASKVTSKGMGLKKAYLQKQNMFTVHCGDAGNNILFVGIHGPKGPCEEVFIKHMGRNNYQVNYVVRERGEYIVLVRWGDEHIPGSPFKVDV